VTDDFEFDRARIEARLDDICRSYLPNLPREMAEAISYGLRSPGKRLRPLLVLFAYRAAGGKADPSLLACAPEVIHSYSLMHDDLPCMDDDDIRRGRPTVHKVYGSRVTIRSGVAMIPMAVRAARDGAKELGLTTPAGAAILGTLLEAAGASGMIGGQQRDLAGEGSSLTLAQREAIHSAKTGALVVASIRIGALAAKANNARTSALEHFGRDVGLAFQIMDDVLDVTSTTSALGKTAGRDAALSKSTYPALLGVEGARQRARTLIDDGLDALRKQGLLTQELARVANFMLTRTS
jgi:geranylgeranyl diphosphate synthase type II